MKTLQRHALFHGSFVFINLFLVNIFILYPQKTPEKLWFSGAFRGYKMRTLAKNG